MDRLTPQSQRDLRDMIAVAQAIAAGQDLRAPTAALITSLAKTVVVLAEEAGYLK